jgi:N-glycosylase/DNA lyase
MQSRLEEQSGIEKLAEKVKNLAENDEVKSLVDERIREFREVQVMDTYKWYEELVYCLLTAYASAITGQRCLNALSQRGAVLEGDLDRVESCLIEEGHRFASRRAEYIYESRELAPVLKARVQSFDDSKNAREWVVKNVKGIGWKEGSHFLRNVGYFDLAILDRHIIRNMAEFGLVEEKEAEKGLTKKRYLHYEHVLSNVAREIEMPLGVMDLYLWYRKTGKVLK